MRRIVVIVALHLVLLFTLVVNAYKEYEAIKTNKSSEPKIVEEKEFELKIENNTKNTNQPIIALR